MIAMAVGMALFFVGEQPSFASAPEPVRGNLIAALERPHVGADGARVALAEPRRQRPGGGDAADRQSAWLSRSACRSRCRCVDASLTDWALIVYLGVFQIVGSRTSCSAPACAT